MTKAPSLDVLLAIFAPAELYPPTLNAVRTLRESGFSVGLVDSWHPEIRQHAALANTCGIQRWQPTRHVLQYLEGIAPLKQRLLDLGKFALCIRSIMARSHPKVVIAYDPYAMFLVGKSPLYYGARLIWHFHELPRYSDDPPSGKIVRRVERFCLKQVRMPDLLVFPDEGRAECFRQQTGCQTPILVVMNCPRKVATLPPRLSADLLDYYHPASGRSVFFQGSMDQSRCLCQVIESMPWWPPDANFVGVGPISKNYKERMLCIAQQSKVLHRVRLHPAVPYEVLPSITQEADLGVGLVAQPRNLNWQFSAGAVNKRFEYMAVGLPQIANVGPGMQEIVGRRALGVLVDPFSPASIGMAVARILGSQELHSAMSERARQAHLSIFNFESQFQPLIERLSWWVNQGRSAWSLSKLRRRDSRASSAPQS